MNVFALDQTDAELAQLGYRIYPTPDGWHVLWSQDFGDSSSPQVCLGGVPQHLKRRLPQILKEHGWPTQPFSGWRCPLHNTEVADD